jgi:hypothetical protein
MLAPAIKRGPLGKILQEFSGVFLDREAPWVVLFGYAVIVKFA